MARSGAAAVAPLVAALVVAAALAEAPALAQSTQDGQPVTRAVPNFTPPVILESAEAEYPPAALRAGLEGTVVLELSLDEHGEIVEAAVKTPAGHGFDEAALAAVRRYRFRPGANDGSPVPSRATYAYHFTLRPVTRPGAAMATVPGGETATARHGIQGSVVERGTRTPLPGVHVAAELQDGDDHRRFEADTDEGGAFALLGLPRGRYAVTVAGGGVVRASYVEKLDEAQLLAVRYYVERKAGSRLQSVVRGTAGREEVSRQTLTTEELVKMPGTFGDALRAVENLPGMARAPFNSGLIIVRGGRPTDSKSFFAGAEVPQLYHFGGLTSVVPSSLVETIDYFPGNFPVRYGRASAGVIDVELREGKRDRLHGYLDVNAFDAGGSIEGPLGRGSFILAARRSYVDALLKFASSTGLLPPLSLSFVTAPIYYDYQAMLDYPLGGGKLRLLINGSDDELKALFDQPQSSDPGLHGALSTHIFFHRLQLRWTRNAGNWSFRLQTSGGWSGTDFGLGNAVNVSASAVSDDSRLEARYRFSDNLKLLVGTDFQLSYVDLTGNAPTPVREGEQPLPLSAETSQPLSEKRVDFSIGAYAELVARITRSLTVTPGVRLDWFGSIQRIGFDPRLGVRYQITPITALKAGIGQYTQDPQAPDVSRSIGNPHLRPERAMQYALSIEQGIWPGLMFEATGFYKSLSDLVVSSNQRILVDGAVQAEHTANLGDGRIYGGEFLLRQSLSRYFFGWISYTLLRSERRDCDGCAWRLFDYDQTHVLVIVAHAYLPRGFEVGARFRYISGNPVTQVHAGTYDSDADVYVPGKYPTNASRLDAFHQLDVRIDKTFTFKRWVLKVYLDVSNVYNHLSPEQLQYSYDYKKSAPFTGLPILPVFGVRGEL